MQRKGHQKLLLMILIPVLISLLDVPLAVREVLSLSAHFSFAPTLLEVLESAALERKL